MQLLPGKHKHVSLINFSLLVLALHSKYSLRELLRTHLFVLNFPFHACPFQELLFMHFVWHTVKKLSQALSCMHRISSMLRLSPCTKSNLCVCVSVVYTKVTQYGNESETTLHFGWVKGDRGRGSSNCGYCSSSLCLSFLSLCFPPFSWSFFSHLFSSPVSTLWPSSSPLRICDLYSRSIFLR